MRRYNLCLLGFGNVGRALARLLMTKTPELRRQYGIQWRITGVATRRMNWIASADGLDTSALLENRPVEPSSPPPANVREWLREADADVLFETTSLNPLTGQPAIDYIRAALEYGAHAITANKGTVVHAYHELSRLARSAGKRFMFESTVADGAPVFSLFRETLPTVNLRAFHGIFNSTTSVIIEEMEAGRTYEEGVRRAQELGVAETDPTYDVDGWDAAVKVCALATVLMDVPLKLEEIKREGIRGLSLAAVGAARDEGRPYKLVARAERTGDGQVMASVRPERVALGDPMASISGASLLVHFELDMMPGLTITSHQPNLQSTAYGLLADFINAVRDR